MALPSLKMLSWYPTDLKVPAKESWKAIGGIEPNTQREKQLTSREKEILEISLKCWLAIPGAISFSFPPVGESIKSIVLLGLAQVRFLSLIT